MRRWAKLADAPDPEIRAAARRLITLIDQNEFSRQLVEFAADVDGRRGITLPGWKEFSTLVGDDEAARALFVEMQREEAPLLAQVFDQPNGIRDVAWDDHLARLMNWRIASQQRGFQAPLGSCATMFFLGSLPGTKISDPAAGQLVQLAQLPPVGELLAADRPENAIRRLVSGWVLDCPSRSGQVLQLRLALLVTYQLTEALPLAKAIARHDPEFLTVFPPQRVSALLAVGKLGSAKDVPDLEPLLEDHTEYLPKPRVNRPQGYEHSVQIRDVALATHAPPHGAGAGRLRLSARAAAPAVVVRSRVSGHGKRRTARRGRRKMAGLAGGASARRRTPFASS